MPKYKLCCGLSTACFCCKLETLAFIVGWIGVVYRIILIVTFSILLSMLTDYDPNIYELAFGIIMGYSVVSFVTSVMLLIGIINRMHLLLLPYLSIELLEILITVLLSLFRGFLLYFLQNENDLFWFVPLMVFTTCFFIYSWIVIMNLYVVYSSQTYNLDDINTNARITFNIPY